TRISILAAAASNVQRARETDMSLKINYPLSSSGNRSRNSKRNITPNKTERANPNRIGAFLHLHYDPAPYLPFQDIMEGVRQVIEADLVCNISLKCRRFHIT